MKKILLIILTISFCGLTACKTGTKKGGDMDKETLVKIETTLGDIEVKLYNETPKHRDNFIKLVKDGVYEGTLFHRVITPCHFVERRALCARVHFAGSESSAITSDYRQPDDARIYCA